ncbi:MAG: hypothetical protein ACYS5W_03920 [Planctomycetota bacterium]
MHTRIYAGMAVALVAGALVLGGPLPRTDARVQEPTPTPSPGVSPVMSPLVLPVPSPAKGAVDPQPQPAPPTDAVTPTDSVVPGNRVVPTDSTPTDSTPADSTPTDSAPADSAPADPDHIGPCPKSHSPVVWQGILDGRPTWKHADGSLTQRAMQGATTKSGEAVQVPVILSVRPAVGSNAAPAPDNRDR